MTLGPESFRDMAGSANEMFPGVSSVERLFLVYGQKLLPF